MKSFVLANGIDASKVTIENVGFPVREPMLAKGKVHAIQDFPFLPTSILSPRASRPAIFH